MLDAQSPTSSMLNSSSLSNLLPKLLTEIPGPKSREMIACLKQYESPTVTFASADGPIFWERAEGCHVWDVDGNRLVDLTSAFGVASLGHSHPRVVTAVQAQIARLGHGMGDVHPSAGKAELCRQLSAITFERWTQGKVCGQCLLGSAGFEAVEMAMKTARIFTGKRGVIAFEHGYHGLGYGALETTWRSDFRKPFADQLGHFARFIPFPRQQVVSNEGRHKEEFQLNQMEEQIRALMREGDVGAILVEPCQGRGGEVIPPDGFLTRLRQICDCEKILLIVDEIYTGFWRTGYPFAVEHEGVVPDLICLGKALSGCLPISVCVGKESVMAAWPESRGEAVHTSTFLGNPTACAAALASIQEFTTTVPLWGVKEKGERWLKRLREQLQDCKSVVEVRGRGLMMGIEFKQQAKISAVQISERMLKQGIIVLPSGSQGEVLALTPPLMIEESVLEWCTKQLGIEN